MSITITCTCDKQFRVKDGLAGKKVKCPACGQVHTVRSTDSIMATAPAVPVVASAPSPGDIQLPGRESRRRSPRWGILVAFAVMLIVGIGGGLLAGILVFRSTPAATDKLVVQQPVETHRTGYPPDVAPPATTPPAPVKPAPPVEDPQAQLAKQAQAHFDKGTAAHAQQHYDAAILSFTEAIRLAPDFAAAYGWRGVCYFRKGDNQTARADLNKAISLNPRDALAYRYRGEVQQADGNAFAAISDFDRSLELKPDDLPTLFFRAQAHASQQNYQKAIEDYTSIIRLDPRNLAAYRGRAGDYYLAGLSAGPYVAPSPNDFDKAIADCNEVLKLQPDELNILELRCQARYYKRDFDQALADADDLIKRRPQGHVGYSVRGFVLFDRKDYEQAVASLNEAIKLNPKDMVSIRCRGFACFYLGDFITALPDLSVTIDFNRQGLQRDANALYCRGVIYNSGKNYQAAIADFTAAIKAKPGFARAYFERSRAYFALGDRVRGTTDYNQALRLDPNVAK